MPATMRPRGQDNIRQVARFPRLPFSALESFVVVLGPGPGIDGLLLLTGKPVIGVVVNAASFAVAAIVSRLRVRSRGSDSTQGGAAQQFAVGFRALVAQPVAGGRRAVL